MSEENYKLRMCLELGHNKIRGFNDPLKKMLYKSGVSNHTIVFTSRQERINYITKLLETIKDKITLTQKKRITVWLKNNKLTKQEITDLYKEIGIGYLNKMKQNECIR